MKFLVRWAAENEFDGDARRTLLDVVDTEISPELLPTDAAAENVQATETTIGPYELRRLLPLSLPALGAAAPRRSSSWRSSANSRRPTTPRTNCGTGCGCFLKRFFANQFKRICLPDGPKVGTVSLSPRGDWRMPSDAQVALWLEGLE